MIRRAALRLLGIVLPWASFGVLVQRGAERLLSAPRRLPVEASLAAPLDALGGEVVRFRSRDGTRLSGRWLPFEDGEAGWRRDPYEAILLLHGWSGSIVPDLVEYGPFLRRTAGVLGFDFGGHGESGEAWTTFGTREVEDVAGALGWLGERGIRRVALIGTSMGGATAIAAVAVLGDGTLAAADVDPAAPASSGRAPRPRIVAVVADSVAPELTVPVANRLRLPLAPLRRFVAGRLFAGAARRVGTDLRAIEPVRTIGLVAPVPVLLIHGAADRTVPVRDGRRLARAAGPNVDHWIVERADHSQAHVAAVEAYEARVGGFLRTAFLAARAVADEDPAGGSTAGILAAPGAAVGSTPGDGSGPGTPTREA